MRIVLALCAFLVAGIVAAATPQQEKQFVDTYRKAYDGKDGKTLTSLLYTRGADPQALGFYKMMLTAEMGGKITSIALLDLTPEDRKRAESTQSPDGRAMKLVLPATKKLVVKTDTKDKNGSSSSTSEMFVAEADGKLYILVPAAAK